MAMYHYIHGQEDLLVGIVELVVNDLYGDPEVHLAADQWLDYRQHLAHGCGGSRWQHCGFTDAGSVAAYRAFSSYLLGHLLLEGLRPGCRCQPIEQAGPGDTPTTDFSRYPRLKSLEPELSQDHSAEESDEALVTLLDRIDRIDLLEHH